VSACLPGCFCLSQLIDAKADLDAAEAGGATPLFIAASNSSGSSSGFACSREWIYVLGRSCCLVVPVTSLILFIPALPLFGKSKSSRAEADEADLSFLSPQRKFAKC
jgi:hypothetical protein